MLGITAIAAVAAVQLAAPSPTGGFMGALSESFGRLHPLTVHLPLGLVLAAALVELWRAVQRRPELSAFTPVALWVAAAFAIVSAATGWLFAESNSPSDTLFWHRWLGIATAVLLLPLAWAATAATRAGDAHARQRWPLVRGGTIACAALVAWVGHLGGGMTWGEKFALRPLIAWYDGARGSEQARAPGTPGTPDTPGTLGAAGTAGTWSVGGTAGAAGGAADAHLRAGQHDSALWVAQVLPALQAQCFECHGNGKAKGGLAIDNWSSLLGQNDDGMWVVKVGDPAASLLLERVLLPADDPDAMPPEGDRLRPSDIEAIRQWIERGAPIPRTASQPAR